MAIRTAFSSKRLIWSSCSSIDQWPLVFWCCQLAPHPRQDTSFSITMFEGGTLIEAALWLIASWDHQTRSSLISILRFTWRWYFCSLLLVSLLGVLPCLQQPEVNNETMEQPWWSTSQHLSFHQIDTLYKCSAACWIFCIFSIGRDIVMVTITRWYPKNTISCEDSSHDFFSLIVYLSTPKMSLIKRTFSLNYSWELQTTSTSSR